MLRESVKEWRATPGWASQGGGHFCVAGRHVVRHDDVSGTFLAAERYFRGDRPFDQPQARLDVLDQAHEV
jgi:hypothetical protein